MSNGSDETIRSGSIDGPRIRGRRLAHYRLIEELGHGGQGFVYLAEDEKIHRRVALKILPQGFALSAGARLRFEREAEAAGRLDHPGIARVFELGEEDGVLFIAMELVHGKTLATHISETAASARHDQEITEVFISLDESGGDPSAFESGSETSGRAEIMGAVRFIESAARALHAAHEEGLVHRDIKPGNLMVRKDGTACVLDFGLAQDDESQGVTLTATGDLMGTPSYMSPEQLLVKRVRLDRRSDVYSLGVCLFECCTLKRPFAGRNSQDLFQAIAQKEPPAPRRLNPKIPKDLEAIILTAIDKDRDRRYPTALEFADDLHRLGLQEPVSARPVGPIVRAQRWVRRNRAVATSGLFVIAILSFATAVFHAKNEETRAALINESRALAAYERLADVKRLEGANASAQVLLGNPPSPTLVPHLESWLEEHEELRGSFDSHSSHLLTIVEEALSTADVTGATSTDSARGDSRETCFIDELHERLNDAMSDRSANAGVADRRSMLKQVLVNLKREQIRLVFDDPRIQFRYDVVAKLLEDLAEFIESDTGKTMSIARLLDQSRSIAIETLEGEAAVRWTECLARIRSNTSYSGLEFPPQLGLIPLGPDPDSGLEEFLHWLTHKGQIPERDPETGRIAVTETLGIIMVLIPGGDFPELNSEEAKSAKLIGFAPPSDPIEPLILSKYEVAQSQWIRAFGSNPSTYPIGSIDREFSARITWRHPVESVSWTSARLQLRRVGLALPNSGSWHWAARGGRANQPFGGCTEPTALDRFANTNDSRFEPHAPIGSFAPNVFGLHDMTGNVSEWCFDGVDSRRPGSSSSKRLHQLMETLRRVQGASYGTPAESASHIRCCRALPITHAAPFIGLRPCHVIRD